MGDDPQKNISTDFTDYTDYFLHHAKSQAANILLFIYLVALNLIARK
jgi:hypothetical protein